MPYNNQKSNKDVSQKLLTTKIIVKKVTNSFKNLYCANTVHTCKEVGQVCMNAHENQLKI